MTVREEITVSINKPVDQVHAALTNEDYWGYVAGNLSGVPGAVAKFASNGGGAEVTLDEVLPTSALPDSARSLVKKDLQINRVITVAPLDGETSSYSFTGDIKGTPVSYKGETTISGSGDTTTFTHNVELTVKVPFMGNAIEPKVVPSVISLLEKEGAITETWIAENN